MTLEKNLTARPLYVRKKEFYHQWVWRKNQMVAVPSGSSVVQLLCS